MGDLVSGTNDIAPWRKSFDRGFIGFIEGVLKLVTRHWLAMVNLALFFFVFLAVLAPVLSAAGIPLASKAILLVYRGFCHQLPYRSYFIFDNQMAFCQRDTAIYASMLLGGLAFAFVRTRLKPINWRLYLVLIAPMAIDGFTQLFGLRESNWQLRTITGALFGLGTIWLLFPILEMGMKDARIVAETGIGRDKGSRLVEGTGGVPGEGVSA